MKRITVVAEEAQIARWKAAAHTRHMTMSDWVRRTLDLNASAVVQTVRSDEERPPPSEPEKIDLYDEPDMKTLIENWTPQGG